MQGVNAELAGDTIKAIDHYQQYLSSKCRHEKLNNIEIDLLARFIGISISRDDWENVCNLGGRLLTIDTATQEQYSNIPWMYLMYVYSLNMLNKCDNIENIVQKGLQFVDKRYSPQEKEYYPLRLQYIVALLNKGNHQLANQIFNELKKINETVGNHIIDEEIQQLEQNIQKEETLDLFDDKEGFVNYFIDKATEIMIWSKILGYKECHGMWNTLVDLAQGFLDYAYFDINSSDDEKIWTKFISWYGILVNGFARGLDIPDRSGYSYDYILTCKNFLDWHSSLSDRKPVKWQQIKDCLFEEEIAIEFVPHSNEALIISSKCDIPKIVEIDSIIIDQLSEYDNNNPMVINDFYKSNSPLTNLIKVLEPYFNGNKRLYISGSNRLAQFNYGAIPYNGTTLGNLFDIVQMSSTANIPQYKSRANSPTTINFVALYGGIDYENKQNTTPDSIDNDANGIDLYTAYPDLRKGYNFLLNTRLEIDSISSLCNQYKISNLKFSGEAANEFHLKNSQYPDPSILHIATHSLLLSNYNYNYLKQLATENKTSRLNTTLQNTGLLLSGCNKFLCNNKSAIGEDGILTAKEICQLDLRNIDLVVLSACSSGLGEVDSVNGIIYGISSAFKTAGARKIMISLWDVNDYTTSLFMQAFYNNLLKGRSTYDSMKMAQNHLISLGYTDPYYWASFILLD